MKIAFSRKTFLEITNSLFGGEMDVRELLSYRLVPVEQRVGDFRRMHLSHGRVAFFGENSVS